MGEKAKRLLWLSRRWKYKSQCFFRAASLNQSQSDFLNVVEPDAVGRMIDYKGEPFQWSKGEQIAVLSLSGPREATSDEIIWSKATSGSHLLVVNCDLF
jgi:hypothetical protein